MGFKRGLDDQPQEVNTSYNRDEMTQPGGTRLTGKKNPFDDDFSDVPTEHHNPHVGTKAPGQGGREATGGWEHDTKPSDPSANKGFFDDSSASKEHGQTMPPNRSGGAKSSTWDNETKPFNSSENKGFFDGPRKANWGSLNDDEVTKPSDQQAKGHSSEYQPAPHAAHGHSSPQSSNYQQQERTIIHHAASNSSDTDELVCGWLVIIDGPGKGKHLTIGPGMSVISRSQSQRITLDFGDMGITSGQQLKILFDDQSRQFMIATGDGTNINRLNGQVLMGQAELNYGDIISVSQTQLRFIPFCDSSFNWS